MKELLTTHLESQRATKFQTKYNDKCIK